MRVFRLKVCCTILLACADVYCFAQADSILLKNSLVSRTFKFTKGKEGFYTTSIKNIAGKSEFIKEPSEDFSIAVNGEKFNGKNVIYDSRVITGCKIYG